MYCEFYANLFPAEHMFALQNTGVAYRKIRVLFLVIPQNRDNVNSFVDTNYFKG